MMAQFPSKEIARLSYAYRTLGLGYANLGGLLMATASPMTATTAARIAARDHRAIDRRQLRHLGRDGGRARRLPRLRQEPRRHAAGHPQPPPRRARRARRLRGAGDPAGAARRRELPRPAAGRGGARAPGTRRWRSARSTASATPRRRSSRRPARSALVMDCDTTGIEPDFALVKFKKLAGGGYFKIINRLVPRGAAHPRLRRGADRRDRALCAGPRHACRARPASTTRRWRRAASTSGAGGARRRARLRLRHQVRVQQMDAGRNLPDRAARDRAGGAGRCRLRPAGGARLLARRDRGRQHLLLRRDDPGRRALSDGRAPRGVRLRQPVRPERHALHLGRGPHPHDGGGAALHHRRDLEDHQHAERRHGRGLQGSLPAVLAARR